MPEKKAEKIIVTNMPIIKVVTFAKRKFNSASLYGAWAESEVYHSWCCRSDFL